MSSREEVKALTDKVLNLAKADAVEVDFERRRALISHGSPWLRIRRIMVGAAYA